jgi:hypothetical protein
MIPDQRELVAELKDKPFTILGINSDGDRSDLQKRLKQEKITWPQIYEGTERDISQRWNVHGYPTLYLIDQRGVIRKRGFLPENEIERAVKDLLAKATVSP